MSIKAQTIESLKARIAALEARPALGETPHAAFATDPLALGPGLLEEIFTDEPRNAGAALGLALGQARGLLGPERHAIIYLQLTSETQETGLPYGPGLLSFGIDPAALVLGRMDSIVDLLWALEEAIACRPVAAVIADIATRHRALDFTASRRLGLKAARTGATVILLRYGRAREASAAQLRVRLVPVVSGETPFDAQAPGPPRWRCTLEKGRARTAAGVTEILLDWTDYGFAAVENGGKIRQLAPVAPPFGALSAALGDRLSEAG